MNKRIVTINGENFIFVKENKKVTVFKYKNGMPQIIDPHFATNRIINQTIIETINLVKDEIKKEIEQKKYTKTSDYHNEFEKRLKDADIPVLKKFGKIDLTGRKEYKEALKELDETYKSTLENKETKKEAVKKNIDVDLQTLFKENGITEYKVSNTGSVITYVKDGIPHTINQINPNTNIYEIILQSIKFDKMNNREEIDKSIKDTMETQRNTALRENDTVNIDKAEYPIDQIADYLKENYHIKNIYGIRQTDKTITDGMLMVDFGKGFQPIFVKSEENGQTKISFGEEKQIDNTKSVTETKVNMEDEKKEDDLNQNIDNYLVDNTFDKIHEKLKTNTPLTEEEKDLLKEYEVPEERTELPDETKETAEEVYEEVKDSDNLQKANAKVKVKRLTPPKFTQAAFANPLFLTFISGAAFGLGVITIVETILN